MSEFFNMLAIGVTDSSSGLTAEQIAQQAQELQDKKIWLAILVALLVIELIVAVGIPKYKKKKAEKKARQQARHPKKK